MSPTVSVQIVTYNSSKDIEACLENVRIQSYQVKEIIVVDNASSDDTIERVRSFRTKSLTNIRLIENEVNIGFAPAHNQAIKQSDSDYVLVLNPDVNLDPRYVQLLVEVMQQNPEIGSATGKLVFQSAPDVIDSTGLVMNRIWRAFDRGAGEPVRKWNQSAEVFGVSGAAAMYSRKMILDTSLQGEFFDEDFFAYKEDVDVAWRAGLLGWKAYYCAEAVGFHKRGWKKGGRSSIPLFVRKHSFINRYKMIYKNLTGWRWLKRLPEFLAYEIAVHGFMLLKEPKVLTAWFDYWSKLPEMRMKRAEIRKKMNSMR
ncbi:glycosyltransferase family 2 protein [Paenibacillus lactis]|uniref:glycosyltransferase family 2 protein n=1 Tax=Paenibacillus lactis TaxID=228574 RepID=UPI00203E9997|nr:glycosyltransferase family 2 protein [Paenibacillus lactis]MCM3493399.1 glycosyltransferase family 2 protein [Paenibacillus lactis]